VTGLGLFRSPITLGKIERFWKTALEELLQRAQFVNFDDAEDRFSFWLWYYNQERPHQSIGRLCPPDRFFEI
jgi:transposase InsO family protein